MVGFSGLGFAPVGLNERVIAASGGPITGTGALTLGAITLSGAGVREIVAVSSALDLPSIVLSGDGTVGGAITGTGALTLPSITMSGTGTREITGTGAVTLPSITMSGTGVREIPGSGDIALPAITMAGAGSVGGVGGSGFNLAL